ncbi:MAG: hypothetical protein H0T79_05110 [Deltaproteobacteria bacterium]|nr:hypothetical protein [Deltaproteobacteria bacterium]
MGDRSLRGLAGREPLPDDRVRFLLEDLGLPESFLERPQAPEPAWFSAHAAD